MSRLTAEQKWDAYDDAVIARRKRLHKALDAVLNKCLCKASTNDASAGEISYQHAKSEFEDINHRLDVCSERLHTLHNNCETDAERAEYEKLKSREQRLAIEYRKARAKLMARSATRGLDATPRYEVRKSRSNDAWAVFEVGDDLPLTSWTNSKAKAMITARTMNGGTVKAKPKTREAAAREVATRTEHNPVVRNYFKLDS